MPRDTSRTNRTDRQNDTGRSNRGGGSSDGGGGEISVPAPTGLTASAQINQITINWSSPISSVTYYRVFRSQTQGSGYTQINANGATTGLSYIDPTVSGTSPYYYVVQAVLVVGSDVYVSPNSSEVSATLPNTGGSALTLDATFESIAIELPYSGDTGSGAATVRYSDDGGTTWLDGIPLVKRYDTVTGWRAFGGALMFLTPNTTYDVEITTSGVDNPGVVEGSITTRAEDIVTPGSLTPTHYISPSGNDTTGDGSSGNPWRSIAKALAYWVANGGNVVTRAISGDYTYDSTMIVPANRSGTFTLVGQTAPVASNRSTRVQSEANVGSHSNIYYRMLSPGSSWVSENFVGPVGGATYQMWTYTVPSPVGSYSTESLGYKESANGPIHYIAKWGNNVPYTTTDMSVKDRAIVEFMHTNDRYRYGFFVSRVDSKKIILRMPAYAPSSDPNSLYMIIGRNGPIIQILGNSSPVNGSSVRLSQLDIQGGERPVEIKTPSQFSVMDYCLMQGGRYGASYSGIAPGSYPSDPVMQDCLVRNYHLRAQPGEPVTDEIPWPWVKGNSKAPGYSTWNRVGNGNEGHAIQGASGSRRGVFRYNTFDGMFNGVSARGVGFDRYAGYANYVGYNRFKNIPDDCIEYEPYTMNLVVVRNYAEYVAVWWTSAPSGYGPHYCIFNEIFRWGDLEIAPMLGDQTFKGVSPVALKTSKSHGLTPKVFMLNNTFYTDHDPFPGVPLTELLKYEKAQISRFIQNVGTGTAVQTKPSWVWRNNLVILMGTNALVHWGDSAVDNAMYDEDYNAMFAIRGTEYHSNNPYTSIATYRSFGPDGANSNKVGALGADLNLDAITLAKLLLLDPDNGDLRLSVGSGAIDRGIHIPGVTDGFLGAAPDLGANEKA